MPAVKSITINFDDNITQVDYSGRQVIWTTSGESHLHFDWSGEFTCVLNEGYIIDTITTSSDITITNKTNTTFNITTENVSAGIITLTSKSNVSKVSIDLTTLTGWDNVTAGEHQISVVAKAAGYRDSEKSAAVSFTKAVINPTYQVVQGTLPTTALSYSSYNKNDLPTSINQSVKTVFDNYSTMTFEDILSALRVDTSELKHDQNKDEVDLTQYQKLTDTCSIFFVKDGSEKYYDYTDNISFDVIELQSLDLSNIDLETTPTYLVSLNVEIGKLSLFSFSNVFSSGTGNITTKGDNILGVAFLITKKVLLKSGTYQFIENPNMNISIDETISGKMNTLTSNNTYGEQTLFDGISVVDSTGQMGMLFIGNSTSLNNVQCAGGDWKYINSDDDEYTTTDTSKLRTIVLEADQYVSQEFYNWAITQGNLVKVEETAGETWVLNSTITAPSSSINQNVDFLCVGTSQNFIRILIESEGKGVHLEYFAQGDSSTAGTVVLSGGITVATEYRTLTFSTAPTGELLTWLQANGTKQGGGTTTAHTLTITDQYSYDTAITVNGNAVTSPYTLQNGDVIKVPTLTKTTINGTSYSTFDESTLNISGEDITVSRSGTEKTTEPVPYITINYTENADSGGNSVSKNWKFNGTPAFMPQMTYSNHVTISGEAYNDTTFVEDFKYIYYADDWSCITFGSAGFWDISKNQYGKNYGNILKFNTEPSGELLAFLQAHTQPI